MALALLELVALERGSARFSIDTGTNLFCRLKFGRSVQRKSGIDWVDDLLFTTPMARSPSGGQLLSSEKDVSVPLKQFGGGNVYVQLFSFKNAEGRSPGFSTPILLPMGAGTAGRTLLLGESAMMMSVDPFRTARTVPCRTYSDTYSKQASLEDLLSGILKAAAPAVLNLLGSQNGSQPASGGAATAGGDSGPAGILALLLKAVLGSLQGGTVKGMSGSQSLLTANGSDGNRFLDGQNASYSRPFIFGIDDALIGALAGPILQMLPQLMNAANQKRVQMKQADNKLITDILSDTNRRLLLEQLLQAQQKPAVPAQGEEAPDLTALIQLLQQLPAAKPAAPAATPAVAAKSLSLDAAPPAELSSKAVITFATADPIPWNGKPLVLFAKNQPMQLKLRLSVAEPAPKSPLPKAILKIVFKARADQTVHFEKTFKQKNVAANTLLVFPFTAAELAPVPSNCPVAVLAEVRWLSPSGREHKALGSTELILVTKFFLKEQGAAASPEKELTDMKLFRPFWNKIWESPSLDAVNNRGDSKKYLWELDVNGKYSVLLSPDQPSNGLMQTKILRGPVDRDSVTDRIDGRMKAGIELSMAELNKLCPIWDGAQALDAEKLNALSTPFMARNNASEFIHNFKLKGKAAERGMIWVAPTFKLFEFTLNSIRGSDDSGQVTAVGEEKVRFPLPVSARLIGLKSQQ